MSIEAPNWYTIQYDQRVRHLLQSEGFLLRGTTDAPVEVKGNTLEFFFIGSGEAQPFGATPERGKAANRGKTIKTVDMTDWQFFLSDGGLSFRSREADGRSVRERRPVRASRTPDGVRLAGLVRRRSLQQGTAGGPRFRPANNRSASRSKWPRTVPGRMQRRLCHDQRGVEPRCGCAAWARR